MREIAPEADRVTRTYRVRVSLDDAAPALKFGQTARVFFASSEQARQQMIPLSALYEHTGQAAVWIVDPQTRQVRLTPVEVASYREQGGNRFVQFGVDSKQWIVTAGVHKLRDGQTIRSGRCGESAW